MFIIRLTLDVPSILFIALIDKRNMLSFNIKEQFYADTILKDKISAEEYSSKVYPGGQFSVVSNA